MPWCQREQKMCKGASNACSGNTDCRVRSVEVDGARITAVTGHVLDPETHQTRQTVRVTADQVVLSGGPIGSPLFLLANGLADNTHCGAHLVVHPTVAAMARFEQEIDQHRQARQRTYSLVALQHPVVGIIEVIGLFSVLGLAAWRIQSGDLDIAGLSSYLTGLIVLIDPIAHVTNNFNEFQQG